LATLAGLLFFYQPLLWWLRRQLRLCQDYLADARAAEQAPEAADYAAYLLVLARRALPPPLAGALGLGDRRSHLYRRILMLVAPHQPLERRCLGRWNLAVAACALALLAAVSAVRLDASAPPVPDKDARKKAPKAREAPKDIKAVHYSGKVTDKETGKPIAGATVVVRRSLYGDPEVKREDQIVQETKHKTDKEGKYRFTIPPEQVAKRYLYIELDVEHPDYAPRSNFGYSFAMIQKNEKMGGRPFFEHVNLRAGKPITGLVQTPEGKPAVGVKVLAYSNTNKARTFEYGSFAQTRTDARGRFRLVLITPGPAVFWILPEKYAPSTHAVKLGKRGDLGTFGLTDGIRLRGKVLDARGKPLAGVNVNAQSAERNEALQGLMVADHISRAALSNARGEFELGPLPPGAYQIKPDKYSRESSTISRHWKKMPVPGVFVARKITLEAGKQPEPLAVRAVPHVTVEARYFDSKGKPTRGHECFIWGQLDKMFWHDEGPADKSGKIVARAPHGLEKAQIDLMTNEHGVLRWRKTKGGPLHNSRKINLGTLNDDVKGIEIIRYTAPILLVKVRAKDGTKLKNVGVTAEYRPGRGQYEGRLIRRDGRHSDVSFEHQPDGRYRSSQLLPDEDVTVIGHADGYRSRSVKLKVAEGVTKDIEIVLDEKAPAKSEKKEKK
jgi:protocatechuate 3,4-dioxygenase beta subunit